MLLVVEIQVAAEMMQVDYLEVEEMILEAEMMQEEAYFQAKLKKES